MPKNIEMSVLNSEGSYDVLYPITIAENVLNLGSFVSENDLILSSTTKELLEISQDSTPDDAFAKLALGTGKWGYKVTLKTPKGSPISGVTIKGITPINGGTCVTDEDGYTFGVSTGESVTLTATSPYYDLNNINQSVQSTNIMTDVELVMSSKGDNGEDTFASTTNVTYSPDVVEFDFCLVGGGGAGDGGGMSNGYWYGGPGGNGGDTTNVMNLINNSSLVKIVVGAGGNGNHNSADSQRMGGNTKITYNSNDYTALGGGILTGGQGGENGPNRNNNGGIGGRGSYYEWQAYYPPQNGGNATVYKFEDASLGFAGGGGGGGSDGSSSNNKVGGSPYGGDGSSKMTDYEGDTKCNSKGYGGGGGGIRGDRSDGGNGYQGVVFIRWRKQAS